MNEELRENGKLRKIDHTSSIPEPSYLSRNSRRKSVGTVGIVIHVKERDLVKKSRV